jgi:hypothetical protein
MEFIITFASTSQAIRAERLLMDAKFKIRVMPLPAQINVGCGVCFRVGPEEIDQAIQLLHDHRIGEIEVFRKTTENKRTSYLPYHSEEIE